MPLKTNVSSNSAGPTFELEISVVDTPGGGEPQAVVTAVADTSKWQLVAGSVKPAAKLVSSDGAYITIVWHDKISAPKEVFRLTLAQRARVTGPLSLQASAWDPVSGSHSSDSWTP